MTKNDTICIVLIGVLASAAAGLLINAYVSNIDLISYISISQRYLHGSLRDAVNAYWSPLFSWLLLPFLLFPVEPVIAAKLLSFLTGLLLVFSVFLFSRRLGVDFVVRAGLALVMAGIVVLCYAFVVQTPDLLGASLVMFYLMAVFEPGKRPGGGNGALAGLWGGLAFLAKHYNFFFVLIHLPATHLILWLSTRDRHERTRILRRFVSASAVFLALSGSWIGMLSLKYGRLTISSAGRININCLNPDTPGHAIEKLGLLEPPDSMSISAWEDPTLYSIPGWNPFQSGSSRLYFLKLVIRNLKDFWRVLAEWSFLSFPILLIAFIQVIRGPGRRFLLFALATVAVYSSGYVMIGVLNRYLLPVLTLIALMGAIILQGIKRHPGLDRRAIRAGLLIFYLFSLSVTPASYISRYMNNHRTFYIDSIKNTDRQIYQVGRALKRIDYLQGRVASNGCLTPSLILAYYLRLSYLGQLKRGGTMEEWGDEIKRFKPDFFLLWIDAEEKYPFLRGRPEITRGRIPELKVYDLRKSGFS